ncbi:unnamed protein product [Brugia timori]|uniref:Uncharacterized protein n=1 Tax=Brugia timori TaxID=42155 RepID=A0A3P7W623_9BILA|nr:unnamed protein product [Brugia timori]
MHVTVICIIDEKLTLLSAPCRIFASYFCTDDDALSELQQYLNQEHVIQKLADSKIIRSAARFFVSTVYGMRASIFRDFWKRIEFFSRTFGVQVHQRNLVPVSDIRFSNERNKFSSTFEYCFEKTTHGISITAASMAKDCTSRCISSKSVKYDACGNKARPRLKNIHERISSSNEFGRVGDTGNEDGVGSGETANMAEEVS